MPSKGGIRVIRHLRLADSAPISRLKTRRGSYSTLLTLPFVKVTFMSL